MSRMLNLVTYTTKEVEKPDTRSSQRELYGDDSALALNGRGSTVSPSSCCNDCCN